jgi:hypothetical protein
VCRSKHVEPLTNFGIINSIAKLNLVGISTELIRKFKNKEISSYFWAGDICSEIRDLKV